MPREKNDSSEGLGDRIRRLRLARDWKQEDLADAADVSKSLISEAENGAQPRGPHLVRIAAALGASLDYLLTGREPAPLATRSRLEVPEELAAVAKRLELPFTQVELLLKFQGQIEATRRDASPRRPTEQDWEDLYKKARPLLDDVAGGKSK